MIACVRRAHLECNKCSVSWGSEEARLSEQEPVRLCGICAPSCYYQASGLQWAPKSLSYKLGNSLVYFLPSDHTHVCSQQISTEHPLGASPSSVKCSRTK